MRSSCLLLATGWVSTHPGKTIHVNEKTQRSKRAGQFQRAAPRPFQRLLRQSERVRDGEAAKDLDVIVQLQLHQRTQQRRMNIQARSYLSAAPPGSTDPLVQKLGFSHYKRLIAQNSLLTSW